MTMAGFVWSTAGIPLPDGMPGDGWCVRDAFCELFRWPRGGEEWAAFIEGPEADDVERLARHLGLEGGFDPLYAPDAQRLGQIVDHPGISCWALHAIQTSHVVFEPHIRFLPPLPVGYRQFAPEHFRVWVDVNQRPRPPATSARAQDQPRADL